MGVIVREHIMMALAVTTVETGDHGTMSKGMVTGHVDFYFHPCRG